MTSLKVLAALVAGILAGLLLASFPGTLTNGVVTVVEPMGTLFVNAIRMTVIPLVVATLIVGVGSAGAGSEIARLGLRGLAVFLALLVASAVAGALIAPAAFSRVTIDPAAAATLRADAATGAAGISAGQSPSFGAWLATLLPANPIAAAADGAMLPLILFALFLGLALRVVKDADRERALLVFRAVAESMLVLVRWVLVLAPLGVFALALPLVVRLGLSALGALVAYVGFVSLGSALFVIVVLYPAAVIGGRMSLAKFARGAAPAQALAFSSRSSLACIPAMMEAGRDSWHYGTDVVGFFIPLAGSLFRVGAPLGATVGAVFVAKLYAIPVSPVQLATIALTAVIASFSVPGIPGGSILGMVPVLASVGLPIESVGVLLGADAIPDMVRTTTNVTGQLTAAVMVASTESSPSTNRS